MSKRFKLSAETVGTVTPAELRAIWARLVPGKPYPQRGVPKRIAASLAAALPNRFEFEVNRQRGYAFDNGETICPNAV